MSAEPDPIAEVEALLAGGQRDRAAAVLRQLVGCTEPEARALAEALGRAAPTVADVLLLTRHRLRIAAALRYQGLFGDDMQVVLRILATANGTLDEAHVRALVATNDLAGARLLVRDATAVGPAEADRCIATVRAQLAAELKVAARTEARAKALRAYTLMFGCSLAEAKAALD